MSRDRPPAVRIREATEDDLPRLIELLAQLSLDAPREDAGPPLRQTYSAAFAEIQADPGSASSSPKRAAALPARRR